MLKPYFVELKIGVVVMAESAVEAHLVAESHESEITNDSDLQADSADLITNLDELAKYSADWTGNCIPYGGDGNTRIKDLLLQAAPAKDTRTIDMFLTA